MAVKTEDAIRLEEIKQKEYEYGRSRLDNGPCSEDILWLISQAETLVKIETVLDETIVILARTQASLQGMDIKLGFAEKALEFYAKLEVDYMNGLHSSAKEALKKMRGEK